MQNSLPFKQHVIFAAKNLERRRKAQHVGNTSETFDAIAAVHLYKAHEQVREARGMGALASLAIERIRASERSQASLVKTAAQLLGREPCSEIQKIRDMYDGQTCWERSKLGHPTKTIVAYVDDKYIVQYKGAPYWCVAEAGETYTKLQRVGHE
jgi:hypothetical protein